MDWLTLHKQSEAHAATAHECLRRGLPDQAVPVFRDAAASEQAALELLDASKPRTLGIIAVSAVALWFKAGALEEASRLANRCLLMDGMPSNAQRQLEDLLVAVYGERDKARMTGQFLPGSVSVAVRGKQVLRGAAPLDLIVDKVKTLQSIFYRVVEWSEGRPLRRRGGPDKDIASTFEPWLVQDAPSSFAFSVAVKVNGQFDMFKESKLEAADIARKFLDVVTTVASDDTGEKSRELIPDADYRGAFRRLVRNLTPTGDTFDSMTITSKERPDAVAVVDEGTRPRLAQAIRAEQPMADAGIGETVVEHVGVLRALDLDADWLKLEVEEGRPQLTVKGLSQAVDDVIGPMVNKRVVVRAVKPLRGNLRYLDIELAP